MQAGGFTNTMVGLTDTTVAGLRQDISKNINAKPSHKRYADKLLEANNLRLTLGYLAEGSKSMPASNNMIVDAKIELQIFTLQEIIAYLRSSLCIDLSKKNQVHGS